MSDYLHTSASGNDAHTYKYGRMLQQQIDIQCTNGEENTNSFFLYIHGILKVINHRNHAAYLVNLYLSPSRMIQLYNYKTVSTAQVCLYMLKII